MANATTTLVTAPQNNKEDNAWNFLQSVYFIAGVPSVIAVILFFIILILCIKRRRQRKWQRETNSYKAYNSPAVAIRNTPLSSEQGIYTLPKPSASSPALEKKREVSIKTEHDVKPTKTRSLENIANRGPLPLPNTHQTRIGKLEKNVKECKEMATISANKTAKNKSMTKWFDEDSDSACEDERTICSRHLSTRNQKGCRLCHEEIDLSSCQNVNVIYALDDNSLSHERCFCNCNMNRVLSPKLTAHRHCELKHHMGRFPTSGFVSLPTRRNKKRHVPHVKDFQNRMQTRLQSTKESPEDSSDTDWYAEDEFEGQQMLGFISDVTFSRQYDEFSSQSEIKRSVSPLPSYSKSKRSQFDRKPFLSVTHSRKTSERREFRKPDMGSNEYMNEKSEMELYIEVDNSPELGNNKHDIGVVTDARERIFPQNEILPGKSRFSIDLK